MAKKPTKAPKGMHQMPDGHMMSDKEMAAMMKKGKPKGMPPKGMMYGR